VQVIFALALAAALLAQNADRSGPAISLQAVCSKGEEVQFYCYTRVAHAAFKLGQPEGVCWPRDEPPDAFKNIIVPHLVNWLAYHPEVSSLNDKEAAGAAFRAVYPCHPHP
jgi:hypothetical protein